MAMTLNVRPGSESTMFSVALAFSNRINNVGPASPRVRTESSAQSIERRWVPTEILWLESCGGKQD